jgi:hypothetical protein
MDPASVLNEGQGQPPTSQNPHKISGNVSPNVPWETFGPPTGARGVLRSTRGAARAPPRNPRESQGRQTSRNRSKGDEKRNPKWRPKRNGSANGEIMFFDDSYTLWPHLACDILARKPPEQQPTGHNITPAARIGATRPRWGLTPRPRTPRDPRLHLWRA